MSMEDGFNPDHPLPPFLAHRPERRANQKLLSELLPRRESLRRVF